MLSMLLPLGLLLAGAPPLKAVGAVELKDPAGDMRNITTSSGEEPPLDVVLLAIKSGGGHLDLQATLAAPPGRFATAPITLYIDADNNPATGIKMFGDGPMGFEYRAELDLCMKYSDGSEACHGGSSNAKPTARYAAIELRRMKGARELENDETITDAMGFPGAKAAAQVPVTGSLVAASADYADLKVKPGQTIRVVARETGGRANDDGYFPAVLLTLK